MESSPFILTFVPLVNSLLSRPTVTQGHTKWLDKMGHSTMAMGQSAMTMVKVPWQWSKYHGNGSKYHGNGLESLDSLGIGCSLHRLLVELTSMNTVKVDYH